MLTIYRIDDDGLFYDKMMLTKMFIIQWMITYIWLYEILITYCGHIDHCDIISFKSLTQVLHCTVLLFYAVFCMGMRYHGKKKVDK